MVSARSGRGCVLSPSRHRLDHHPAGSACLLKHAGGTDCTRDFEFHSPHARDLWKKFEVRPKAHVFLCFSVLTAERQIGRVAGVREGCAIL